MRRERSTADERVVTITITTVGEALKQKAAGVPVKIMQCMKFSTEEAQTLYTLLYKLLDSNK